MTRKPIRSLDDIFAWSYPEPNTGCWLWGRSSADHGNYTTPKAWFKDKTVAVPRLAWHLANGSAGEKHVLHKCDVSICVNPDHMYLGTHQDNMRDMKSRKRARRFPIEKSNAIRADFASGVGVTHMIKKHGASYYNILKALRKEI